MLFLPFFYYFIYREKFQSINYFRFISLNSVWDSFSLANNANLQRTNITKFDKLNEFYQMQEGISKMNVSLRKISLNNCKPIGYANRLYSILSSFVIAILTNSQLVVKWKEIEPYVDLPIRVFNENLTIDEGISKIKFRKLLFHAKPAQSWSRTKKIEALMKTSLSESAQRYLYTDIGPYFMELCSNPKYFSKLSYYNLVKNETIDLALEAISNNKSTHIDKQERIFQIGFEVGGNLLNRMWRPKKSIMEDVRKYFEKYFRNNFVIGIQLRYLYLNKQDINKFINCALEIEKDYLLRSKTSSTKISSFKWFIASDTQREINQILKAYPNRTFTTNEYVLGHILENKHSFHRAMLDVELLSLCDELIVTGPSTFGWVAAMKSLKLPLFINGHNRTEKCLRSKLSDPPSGGKGPYASF